MKHLKVFIFAAFALVSAVVLRTIQLLFLTDSKTGFYKEGMETAGTAVMVFLVVIIAIASLLIFLFEKKEVSAKPSSSVLLGSTALFAGIANLIEPFFNEVSFSAVPELLLTLRFIMILASGVTLCWFGAAILFNMKMHSVLSIVLIVTWVIRLMSSFICFTEMSVISENLYDVLMLISTLLFFLFFGKAVCGISKSKTNRKLIMAGIAAVLFTAVSSLPCIFAYLVSDFAFAHIPIDNPITGLFMALFIGVYLVDICKNKAEN